MRSRRLLPLITSLLAAANALLQAQAAAAGEPCVPSYDPSITPPAVVIAGWPARSATTDEIDAYVTGIALETDRVATGQFATSWNGRPLYYALVGEATNVADADAIAAAQRELRDPRVTSPEAAAAIAAGSPAIVWYQGNIHGNETSGGDAALQILYELAARTDCVGEALRASLLVGVISTQNPDGRIAGVRANGYGFDLARDGVARTQPENDGRLALLQHYPPALLADGHEMFGGSFFFPPAADPVHHEISTESLDWQNGLYGPALAQAFDERQPGESGEWTYFNFGSFDLLVPEYPDTLTTLAFGAAGMTFEKGSGDPAEQRFEEHFVAGWTALLTAAEHKEQLLAELYQSYERALADGGLGALEPNAVQEPGNAVVQEVPDEPVRHYFLGTRRARADADRLVTRLRALGVEVYRLTKALEVPRLRAYGGRPKTRRLPKGTYWIPLEQPQKRWVQAALGEDGYASVPHFYDVAAWSEPLAGSLEAWLSGARLKPAAERVTDAPRPPLAPAAFHWIAGDTARSVGAALALADEGLEVRRLSRARGKGKRRIPAGAFVVSGDAGAIEQTAARFEVPVQGSDGALPPGLPVHVPRIAVYDPGNFAESFDHLRFLLERVVGVSWTPLDGPAVAAGQLSDFDVLLVTGVSSFGLQAARTAIESWIEAGGIYVGTARPGGTGGTPFAIESGWTSAAASDPAGLDVPGSFFRVELESGSPLTLGAGEAAYWMFLGEQVLSRTTTGVNVGRFPSKPKKLWFSGYAEGEEALLGSAALVEEGLGAGRVLLFSGEPNFRAWTAGTQLLLANAIVYPDEDTLPLAATDVRAPDAAPAVARARASVGPPVGPGRPIRIRVPAAQADDALAVARRFTTEARLLRTDPTAVLEIPNPEGLDAEEHPFSRELLQALREAGIQVLYAAL
jgi:hypothetical protein